MKKANAAKELYKQMRALSWEELWSGEVPRFERAGERERFERVGVIRAVGVVFAESGPAEQREEVRQWMRKLLKDPQEKIRRYAMTELPKLGASADDEAELLALFRKGTNEREAKYLGRSLDKIGGKATLETLVKSGALSVQTEQKVKASVARNLSPTRILLDRAVSDFAGLRIHLRGRAGLEGIVRDEVEGQGRFRVENVQPGLVVITAKSAFTLSDVFALRCFGTIGFVLGCVKSASEAESVETLAKVITSPLSQRLFSALTEGAIRYRLDFVAKGHQRGAVREIANRAYALCPQILNDAREAPWAIDIHPTPDGDSVELRPTLAISGASTTSPLHRIRRWPRAWRVSPVGWKTKTCGIPFAAPVSNSSSAPCSAECAVFSAVTSAPKPLRLLSAISPPRVLVPSPHVSRAAIFAISPASQKSRPAASASSSQIRPSGAAFPSATCAVCSTTSLLSPPPNSPPADALSSQTPSTWKAHSHRSSSPHVSSWTWAAFPAAWSFTVKQAARQQECVSRLIDWQTQ